MNLITVFQRFPDQESCIEHLENVRWRYQPECPHCRSDKVARKADGQRVGRWNCHSCKSSFNVLSKTIFQKTRVPLQKWFLAIALLVNAKKSMSAHQLARDLELNRKTAWYLAMRIRRAMAGEAGELLYGIVEADEAYIGGKPRKRNRRDNDDPPAPRGRGTSKTAVVGVAERGGRVVAEPTDRIDSRFMLEFISANVDSDSLLMTDEFRAYDVMTGRMKHLTVDHQSAYVHEDGITHTNTIEGFWSLLKRAWYGSHHHYTRAHIWAYVAEACFKYNVRKSTDAFGAFMRTAMEV